MKNQNHAKKTYQMLKYIWIDKENKTKMYIILNVDLKRKIVKET